jgi:hypothetical protein
MRSSTPYPISLSVRKLQKILDVCEPMDHDVFNMVVRILAPKALEKSKGQQETIRKALHGPAVQCMSLNVFTT